MKKNKYSLGLSSFSLLSGETIVTTGVYLTAADWKAVKNKVIEENLLQRTHRSTSIVTAKEIIKRLRHADDRELESLAASDDPRDTSFICMLLVARQYPLLQDITTDLLRYKYEGGDFFLEPYEIDGWYGNTAVRHPEIDAMKPGSYRRLVGNTRRILMGGGLLREKTREDRRENSAEGLFISRPGISRDLEQYYRDAGSAGDLRMMLYSEGEIQHLMEERRLMEGRK